MVSYDEVMETMRTWLLGDPPLSILQVALAALLVYVFAFAIVRTGKKRFLGRNTVFDAILGFMLGSTLARAINGDAGLGPTVVAGFVLVGAHWLFGLAATRSQALGRLFKGDTAVVVRDGAYQEKEMARHHISRGDIEEAMYLRGGLCEIEEIQEARFERNGDISVIRTRTPHVVDVDVAEGVQTVRIEMAPSGP